MEPSRIRGSEPSLAPSLPTLLWAVAVGSYLLIVLGGVSRLGLGEACTAWPTCGGGAAAPLADVDRLVSLGHRVLAAGTGILLLGALGVAWRQRGQDRIVAGLLAATLLYPIQVWVGALRVESETARLAGSHLVLGVTIFTLVLLVLPATVKRDERGRPNTRHAGHPNGRTPSARSPRPVPNDGTAESDGSGRIVAAYLSLTKPRLMWLLSLVAVAGMVLAAGAELPLDIAVTTVVGGVLAIGASGTFNHVFERHLDRHMSRTDGRPLTRGTVSVRGAMAFGLVLATLAIGLFAAFVNLLAAVLTALAIVCYSVGYTLVLKPHTKHNIVLGGIVGAFPVLIGWAAVEDAVGMPALALGVLIVLWTPAHFYNLALAYREDYAAASVPMLPVVSGVSTTHHHIVRYLGATLVAAVIVGRVTGLGSLYATAIIVLGAGFLWFVIRSIRLATDRAAMRAFHASNAYLGGLLVAAIADVLLL